MIVSRLAQKAITAGPPAVDAGAKLVPREAAPAEAKAFTVTTVAPETFPTRTHLVYGGLALAAVVGLWLLMGR